MSGAAEKSKRNENIIIRLVVGLVSDQESESRPAVIKAIEYINTHPEQDLTDLKETLLLTAIALNDFTLASRCIDEWRVSINIANGMHQTLLYGLMRYDHANVDWICFLIEKGADPSILDTSKYSVLHAAAEHGRVDCLAYLIEHYPKLLPDQGHYLDFLTRPFANMDILPQHIDTFCYLLGCSNKEDIANIYGMDLLYTILSYDHLSDEGEMLQSKLGLARLLCHEYGVNPRGTTSFGQSLAEHIVHGRRSRPAVKAIIATLCTEWDQAHGRHRVSDPSSVESAAAETATAMLSMRQKDDELEAAGPRVHAT